MKRSSITIIVCAAALVGAATAAHAGEVSGMNILTPRPSETTDLGNGIVYQTTVSSGVITTADPDHPLNAASGYCSGGCVSKGEDAPSCMGSCTWADTDGDLAFSTWTGQTEGTWKMDGGTGKWAKATGSGTWKASAVYAGGAAANSWHGSMAME